MNFLMSVLYYLAIVLIVLFLLAAALLLHKIGTIMKWEIEDRRKAANVAPSEEVHQ